MTRAPHIARLAGWGGLAVATLLLYPAVAVQGSWQGISEDTFRIAASVAAIIGVVSLGAARGATMATRAAITGHTTSIRRIGWTSAALAVAGLLLAFIGLQALVTEAYTLWVSTWAIAALALLLALAGAGAVLGHAVTTRTTSHAPPPSAEEKTPT
jgi:hypothetical protein